MGWDRSRSDQGGEYRPHPSGVPPSTLPIKGWEGYMPLMTQTSDPVVIASYARTVVHTTTDFSFYMVAIVNGTSVIGRVVPYLLVAYIKPIGILIFSVTA